MRALEWRKSITPDDDDDDDDDDGERASQRGGWRCWMCVFASDAMLSARECFKLACGVSQYVCVTKKLKRDKERKIDRWAGTVKQTDGQTETKWFNERRQISHHCHQH